MTVVRKMRLMVQISPWKLNFGHPYLLNPPYGSLANATHAPMQIELDLSPSDKAWSNRGLRTLDVSTSFDLAGWCRNRPSWQVVRSENHRYLSYTPNHVSNKLFGARILHYTQVWYAPIQVVGLRLEKFPWYIYRQVGTCCSSRSLIGSVCCLAHRVFTLTSQIHGGDSWTCSGNHHKLLFHLP